MLIVICFFSFLLFLLWFLINYSLYTSYLKKNHFDKWKELYSKDPFLPDGGPELRWLREPVAPLVSIFNLKEDYGDPRITIYKKRAKFQAFGILASLILLTIIIPLVGSN